jgi:hypothetical protein
MASRWLRRNAGQRFAGSGCVGVRFIQREIVCSETSKPSIRSSPWMRGAPHVGFSTTIRKISSLTSFEIRLLPTGVLNPEISRRYRRKPAWCQPTTVSGVTTIRACFHSAQNRPAAIQKSLSSDANLGLGRRYFRTASCWRSARFSKRSFLWLRKRRKRTPNPRAKRSNVAWSYSRWRFGT